MGSVRCFCGVLHCPHARAVAAQEVRQWIRSKTPEERDAMAEEITQRVLERLKVNPIDEVTGEFYENYIRGSIDAVDED